MGVMPTLLDPPSDDVKKLLRAVAAGFHAANGEWPIWQYVEWLVAKDGLDAEQLYRGLPVWEHGYSYIGFPGFPAGARPAPAAKARLTIAGIFHAGDAGTNELMDAFVHAVRAASDAQRTAEPTPTQVVNVGLHAADLAKPATVDSAPTVSAKQLGEVLEGEPATWSGLKDVGSSRWSWNLDQVRLSPYRGITTGLGYLAALEELVGHPPITAHRLPLPPMAIPDALDYLDLTWRLVTHTQLMHVKRAALPSVLTQAVASAEEFESRCSAIAILFNAFTTGVTANKTTGAAAVGTLAGMKAKLTELLGDEAGRANDAVEVLRSIVAVRTGQQHRERDEDAERARVALGLATFGSDWQGAWEHLRHRMVDALQTIREEVSMKLS
jgi:hypothetical protein